MNDTVQINVTPQQLDTLIAGLAATMRLWVVLERKAGGDLTTVSQHSEWRKANELRSILEPIFAQTDYGKKVIEEFEGHCGSCVNQPHTAM